MSAAFLKILIDSVSSSDNEEDKSVSSHKQPDLLSLGRKSVSVNSVADKI